MPSGWSFRHFVFFHEKAHFLIGLCHRQPNNKAISEVFLYDERPSESDKAVFSHQLSWTFFWRELWLTQWRNSQYRGRTITNLYFADDIYGLAWKEERLASLVDRLERRPNWSRIKNGVSVDIRVNGKKLNKMDSFKCVGQSSQIKVLSLKYCPELHKWRQLYRNWRPYEWSGMIRISPLAQRSDSWRLMGSLIVSAFLYACETWSLIANIQKKLQASEMRCFGNCWHLIQKPHH